MQRKWICPICNTPNETGKERVPKCKHCGFVVEKFEDEKRVRQRYEKMLKEFKRKETGLERVHRSPFTSPAKRKYFVVAVLLAIAITLGAFWVVHKPELRNPTSTELADFLDSHQFDEDTLIIDYPFLYASELKEVAVERGIRGGFVRIHFENQSVRFHLENNAWWPDRHYAAPEQIDYFYWNLEQLEIGYLCTYVTAFKIEEHEGIDFVLFIHPKYKEPILVEVGSRFYKVNFDVEVEWDDTITKVEIHWPD